MTSNQNVVLIIVMIDLLRYTVTKTIAIGTRIELTVIVVAEAQLVPFCGHFFREHFLLQVCKDKKMSKWQANRGDVQLKGGNLIFNPSSIVAFY